jgi:hypothetical protein
MSAPDSPTHPLIASDRVEGTAVYDRAGRRLGNIRRLMIEKVSGQVIYAVVSFGAFRALANDSYIVPWAKLRYDKTRGGYCTEITEAELQHAPSYARSGGTDWPSPEQESELQAYFRLPADRRAF